ncbi:MAG TPA: hypothetical protein VIK60_02080 [Vicinamibacterales bacterium]
MRTDSIAVTEPAAGLAGFHASAQPPVRLLRQVLQEQRVHRSLEAVDAEPVMCEGTDLIARPDITDRLRALLGVDLQELTVVDRTDLRDMDE